MVVVAVAPPRETGTAVGTHEEAGLTTAWWQVLGAVGYSPSPLPVAHVARNMGLARQSVQRVVDLLEQRGMVRYQSNPHHRRAKLVVLTAVGRSALDAAEAAEEPLNRAMLEQIGAERIGIALDVLTEMGRLVVPFDDYAAAGDEDGLA